VEKFPNRPALGWRPTKDGVVQDFEYMTYTEMAQKVADAASAFVELGLSKGGAVGVYAANAPEWMIAMKAVDRTGGFIVLLTERTSLERYIVLNVQRCIVLRGGWRVDPVHRVWPAAVFAHVGRGTDAPPRCLSGDESKA
jgi:acyl-CoA synthetase (AMP-forming)/AMP-acid ligase II